MYEQFFNQKYKTMKRLIILLMLLPTLLWSQNINKMEYFIDTDPGFGLGINVPLTVAVDIANINIPVNVSAVTEGFHKMYVRSRDVNGLWSETAIHPFYKASTAVVQTLPALVEIEYFVNTDPGVGNGTKQAIPPASMYTNSSLPVCLKNAVTGANKLYVRTKTANGKWSETTAIPFTFSGTAPTDCNAVLPLELITFLGEVIARNEANGGSALLNWQTIAEINVNNFELEKSTEGKVFTTIARRNALNGAPNSTPSVYSAIDDKFTESSYYRLKINDLDGISNYSKIIYLEKNNNKTLKITQNTEGSILIETNDKIELITVTNNIGQLIKSTKEKRFLISEFNSGIYIISVKTDRGYLSKKIFKN
jgi:hypothetical protein